MEHLSNYGSPFQINDPNFVHQQNGQTSETQQLPANDFTQLMSECCRASSECFVRDFREHPGFVLCLFLTTSLILIPGTLVRYTTNDSNSSQQYGSGLMAGSVFFILGAIMTRIYAYCRIGERQLEQAETQETNLIPLPEESTRLLDGNL